MNSIPSPSIKDVRDALIAVMGDYPVYHFWASNEHGEKYVCFAEDADVRKFTNDNGRQYRVMNGTVDLFTKTEFDQLFRDIEVALLSIGCSVDLNSTQFEPTTGYTHYEWIIEFYG